MLKLGFVALTLCPRWMAFFNPHSSKVTLSCLDSAALAQISFYSAGVVDPIGNLEKFYSRLLKFHRQQGVHLDDLSEEFDYEMIVEIASGGHSATMQHTFLRLCQDVIVVTALSNHFPGEEEMLRNMLTSLTRSELAFSAPDLARLEIPIGCVDWGSFGDGFVSMGNE